MTKEEFITIAHAAQNDAGTKSLFNDKVTEAGKNLTMKNTDPVAAFLAHLLDLSNDNTNEAIESFDFYLSELERVSKRLKSENKKVI